MINPQDEYISLIVGSCEEDFKQSKVPIVSMDSYLGEYLKHCSSLKEIAYPYTINIPRSIDYMLKTRDFSPLKKIVIPEPIMYKGNPIWTRSSLKGVGLGFGFENSNKRELSDIYLGNVSDTSGPHFHLAGKSGGGKSVCLSNIIFNILFAYSPYEVNLHLIDAKISEAARYAQGNLLSHIKTIGATSDTGYVISITDYMTKKAEKLNQLFAMVGVNNLADFRKETGLTMARDVLIVDEYQLQYQKATSKEGNQLTNNYDQLCTAGRSSGTHLGLTTQSFLPDLKKKLFKNIEVRASLTCEPSTSEATLGNSCASDCKNVGEIYVNMQGDQSIESTRMFKVPFQDKQDFDEEKEFLAQACKKYNMDIDLNYFDENLVLSEEVLIEMIDKYGKDRRLVMGNPAFLKSKDIDSFYFNHSFEDMENILYFSPKTSDVREFVSTMSLNYKSLPVNRNLVYYLIADKASVRDIELPDNAVVKSIRKTDNSSFIYLMGSIYRKIAMLEADEEIFNGYNKIDVGIRNFMNEYYKDRPSMVSELNVKRVSLYVNKLNTPAYTKLCNIDEKNSKVIHHALLCLEDLLSYSSNFITTKVTKSNLPVTYINIVGFDKIDGLTRGNTFQFSEKFKSFCFDAPVGNVCIVCYATNVMGLTEYNKIFRFIVSSNSKNQETKLGLELPNDMPSNLAYCCNPNTGDMYRFKRLHLEGNDDDIDVL